ncbi:MAG: transcription antitermination factor NusB [Clostridia bacterium]|nr:transcription antitermination factor NusB [Clostridia bacterium]
MKRTDARELAFKTIYSKFFNNSDEDTLENADTKDLEFTNKILKCFAQFYNEINETISSNLKGYTIDRLYKVDLAILVLAIIELNYLKENPKEVVINEAVELAKKYSTDKSPKFINGFLASIVK